MRIPARALLGTHCFMTPIFGSRGSIAWGFLSRHCWRQPESQFAATEPDHFLA
jgi:hypothetical protein